MNFNNGTSEDLSFNIAVHDNVNYVVKTIYLNVDNKGNRENHRGMKYDLKHMIFAS